MRFTKSFPVICLIIISILTYSVLTQDQPSNPDDNATPNDNTTPNNNTTPSDNTTPNDNTTLSNNAIHSLCPPPLIIRNPDEYVRTESQNCIGDCCLACPFSYNFYEKNKIENTYKAFSILGIISFSLMLILAFIFIKLPSQKQNPLSKLILLPLALSVMIFEGSEFFTVNQRQSQCNNPITPADKNNNYCAAQAFFTLGGGFAIACYSALLMTHLHLISVWRIEFISNKIVYFHFLIVGASLAAFMIPYVNNLIQSTGICFVSLEAAPAFFYSLSFIYIAFVAHLSTFIHMAHISIKSNNRHSTMSRMSMIEAQRKLIRLKTIINIQWRSLLGALLMLIIYILNWYYYIFELRSLTDPVLTSTWINGWVGCLQSSSGDLDLCAKQFSDNVPSYNYIFTLLFFNRTAGILIFIIFAVKRSVLLDVLEFIGVRRNGSNANVSMSYYEESKYPSIRTRDSLAKRKFSSDRFGNNVADIRNMRYSMNKDIAAISDIDSDSFDIESNLGIESGPGIGRNSFGVENGLDALSNKSSEKSRNYLDAPTENLDAFSENNVDAVSENNVYAYSENNVDAISESNVDAISESNVDAISESNVDAISESNVDAISESNVDAISESNVDAISESNVDAISENNVDAYSENNVDAYSENNVDAYSENNVDAYSENNVDAYSENNVDAVSENNVDAFSENNVDAVSENNVDAFSESNVDAVSESNVDAYSESNVDVFSENTVDVFSETNGDAFSETNGDGLSEAFSIVSRDTSIITSKDPPMSRRIIRFSQDLPSRRDFFPLPPMSDDDM